MAKLKSAETKDHESQDTEMRFGRKIRIQLVAEKENYTAQIRDDLDRRRFVVSIENLHSAIEKLGNKGWLPVDVIVAFDSGNEPSILQLLRNIKRLSPSMGFIVIANVDSKQSSLRYFEEGADDCVELHELDRLPFSIINTFSRTNAEKALTTISNERETLLELVDAAGLGMIVIDSKEMIILRTNDVFRKMCLDRKSKHDLEIPCSEIIAPDAVDEFHRQTRCCENTAGPILPFSVGHNHEGWQTTRYRV